MKTRWRRTLSALTALALLGVTGCSGSRPRTTVTENAATLAPALSPYEAPVGTGGLSYTASVPLYLPTRDGQRLTARQTPVTFTHGEQNVRETVLALLQARGDGVHRAIGGQVDLQLTGQRPIETAGGICTVNLAPSALALEYDELYTLILSLASTLGGTGDVRYVNLLVADQAVSFDVAGNLPAGSVTAHPGEDLALLWEQQDARRTPLGQDPTATPLSATATLYFPLADGSGFTPETRNLTFTGQTPQQLASGLLTALSSGAQYLEGTAEMPDIPSLLTLAPEVSELAEGGRMITLFFSSDLEDRLAVMGTDLSCFTASVVWTLTTFIPSVGAVRIVTGSTLMTTVAGAPFGTLSFENGMLRRRQFREGLRGETTVCLARNGRLATVTRSVPASDTASVPALLGLMMAGPTPAESASGVTAVLPAGLGPEDLLGVAVADGTLLINLSGRFADSLSGMDAGGERLACYAMVNTLCGALGLTRARFSFDGETRETLGGEIYWGGEFILNRSLAEPNRG